VSRYLGGSLRTVFLMIYSDALLVTATLNGLGGLVRLRATVATRIVNAVLNFNPFALAKPPLNSATKLMIKSMEKTVSVFLTNLLKRCLPVICYLPCACISSG
jgi:hypothetical protein